VFAKCVGEIQKLSGVARKAGELGKNQAGDVTRLDVFEHPLRFRMIFDGFTAYRFKVVDLFDFPILGFA